MEIVKGRKEKSVIFSCIIGKMSPTAKFPLQLTSVATAIAADLGAWVKSSPVINQGIEPGPNAKNVTKPNAATIVKMPVPFVSEASGASGS